MSDANDLIERLEKETGQRLDVSDPDNSVVAGLFGAMSRIMGNSPSNYKESDDVVAGLWLLHTMTPEYQNEQESRKMIADMLRSGMSPDDIKKIFGDSQP